MLLTVCIAPLDYYNKRQVQLLTVVDNKQKYAESKFHLSWMKHYQNKIDSHIIINITAVSFISNR